MMAPRPATITQTELTRLAKAMQETGILVWSVDVEKPDGTRFRFNAGSAQPPAQTPARGEGIDKRLGITNG